MASLADAELKELMVAAGAGDATAGLKTFKAVCQACHLSGGTKLGTAGQPILSTSVNAKNPVFVRDIVRNGKTGNIGTMAGFDKDTVSDADLENVIAYLATLK